MYEVDGAGIGAVLHTFGQCCMQPREPSMRAVAGPEATALQSRFRKTLLFW